MSSFKKQLLFIILTGAVITSGVLVIYANGNLKIEPSETAKLKMVKQENTTSTTNNPVGWWKFDETTAIHGTTLADSSGYGNTGTLSTGDGALEKSVAGKLGRGLSFDGVDDYVSVADDSVLDVAGNTTISFWFKRSTIFGTIQYLIGKGGNNEYSPYSIGFGTDNKLNFLQTSSAGTGWATLILNAGSAVIDTNWHFVVVRNNGIVAEIYLDNVLIGTDATPAITLWNNSAVVSIGCETRPSNGVAGRFFNGLIDDPRIYSRALSATEIAQMYNSTKDGYLGNIKMSTGLVGYWKMDDNLDTTAVRDYSGKNNNGVFTDATGNPFTSAHTTTTAQIGRAMVFDGVDDYVAAVQTVDDNVAGALTISLWFKTNSNTTMYLWHKGTQFSRLSINNPTVGMVAASLYGLTDAFTTFTDSSIVDGKWHHISQIYTGNSVTLYLDGVAKVTDTSSGVITTGSTPFYIGSFGGTSYYFNGLIDDVRIYNYARTAEQIKQDYERGLRNLP